MEGVIGQLSASQYVRPGMVLVFALILFFFAAMSAVLNYHWKKYVLDKAKLKKARFWYFSVAGVVILVSLISLIFIL